jgi:tetratricopeptide (TPR) repeat protein
VGIRASEVGLKVIDEARKQKGWKRQDCRWWSEAQSSLPVLKRFRARQDVGEEIFKRLCKAVGINDWEGVADLPLQDSDASENENVNTDASETLASNSVFVGRETDVVGLDALVRQGKKMILIWGEGGVGKTTLAQQYLDQEFDQVIVFDLAKERKSIGKVENLLENKLILLGKEPGREFAVSLERLRQALETKRIGVLIDNLEPALERGCFVEEHRPYVELLRTLTTPKVQSVTLITSRERLYEPSVSLEEYRLRGLNLEAWRQFFTDPMQAQPLQVDEAELLVLAEMNKAYGGNAKAMEILRGAVREDAQGNLQRYWQRNKDHLLRHRGLENLIVEQFKRLQEVDLNAYNLLCRLGCYRYQDVPTVPLEGVLCLLWDVHRQELCVVDALKDRALVEFKNDEYWLHPMVREEAVRRLEVGEEWILSNQRVAEFWKNSVDDIGNLSDALNKLEAYYHYINVEEYGNAADLLLPSPKGYLSKSEYSLIGRLRGFGAYQKPLKLLEFLSNQPNLSIYQERHIWGYKGDFYAILGFSKKASISYQKSLELAQSSDDFVHRCDLMAALALLMMNLGKYLDSVKLLKESLELSIRYSSQHDLPKSMLGSILSCISFAYYRCGDTKQSLNYLILAIDEFDRTFNDEFTPSSWWTVYGNYFYALSLIAHNFFDKAEKVSQYLDNFHQKYSYPLAQGVAIEIVGRVYLKQFRPKESISSFAKAEEIFERLEAKNNLAELYFQSGIAYQINKELNKSLVYRDKAIQLFTELEAPRQVEWVKLAFENLE